MRLKRNTNRTGWGKYAVVNLDKLAKLEEGMDGPADQARQAIGRLETLGILTFGKEGSGDEFFVLKLKDIFASSTLTHYAGRAGAYDQEYGKDVRALAVRSVCMPGRKIPD